MKKTLFLITLTLLVNCSFGQFKILSNYTAEMTNGALTFKTSNPGVEIGGNDNQGVYQTFISFYHSTSSWNKIKAHSYSTISDSTLKTNITPLQNASEVLNNIR